MHHSERIAGISPIAHLEENAAAAAVRLSPEQVAD